MGGASDAWVTYGKSTARSIYYQLRAFAAFDPHALSNACGEKGVMLRFGGMTLDGVTVRCRGKDGWGETGAKCPEERAIDANFYQMVTQADDNAFLSQAGETSEMILETDRAAARIRPTGIELWEKSGSSCPQPMLNLQWRCEEQGGVSNRTDCLWGLSQPEPLPSSLRKIITIV